MLPEKDILTRHKVWFHSSFKIVNKEIVVHQELVFTNNKLFLTSSSFNIIGYGKEQEERERIQHSVVIAMLELLQMILEHIQSWPELNFGGRTTEMDSAQQSVNHRVLVRGGDFKKKKIYLALVSLRFFCRREQGPGEWTKDQQKKNYYRRSNSGTM